MSLKVTFNNQIHKLSKAPVNFTALTEIINVFYRDQLPTRWVASYTDSDGDNITVADQHDYENLLEHIKESPAGKTVRLTVIEVGSNVETEEKADEGQSMEDSQRIEEKIEAREPEVEEIVPLVEKVEEKLEDLQIEEKPVMEEKAEEKIVEELEKKLEEPVKEEEEVQENIENKEVQEKIEEKPVEQAVEEKQPQVEVRKESWEKVEDEAEPDRDINGRCIHKGVKCDGCEKYPIVGTRYKCTVCQDFDYCEECEDKIEHPHHFIKMKFAGNYLVESLKKSFNDLKNKAYSMKDNIADPREAWNKMKAANEVRKAEEMRQQEEAAVAGAAENRERSNSNNENKRGIGGFFGNLMKQVMNRKEDDQVSKAEKEEAQRNLAEKTDALLQIFEEADKSKLTELVQKYPYGTIEQLADAYLRGV